MTAMEKPEVYARAIRTAMTGSGQKQSDLAKRMGIHEDTLGRKLKNPRTFTLGDLILADDAVKWTKYMEVVR